MVLKLGLFEGLSKKSVQFKEVVLKAFSKARNSKRITSDVGEFLKIKRLAYEKMPSSSTSLLKLAVSYSKLNRHDEVILVVEKFLNSEATNKDLCDLKYQRLYEVLFRSYMHVGDFVKAKPLVEELNDVQKGKYLMDLADIFYGLGDHEAALSFSNNAFKNKPNDVAVLRKYFEIMHGVLPRSQVRDLISVIIQTIDLKAIEHEGALKDFGRFGVYLGKLDYQDLAEQILSIDAEQISDDQLCQKALLTSLCKQRKFEEALSSCNSLINKYPEEDLFHLRLADVYSGLGANEIAAEKLTQYVKRSQKTGPYLRFAEIHRQRQGVYSRDAQSELFFAKNAFLTCGSNLNEVQKRVVTELEATGIATTSIEELFTTRAETEMIQASLDQFLKFRDYNDIAEKIDRISQCEDFGADPFFKDIFKPSVVRYTDMIKEISAFDPLICPLYSEKILSIANTYNGMLSRLRNVNAWINPKIVGKNVGARKGSQIWHRDQEDEKILKCFIYFSDVDEVSGALDYVKYSKCTGDVKYKHLHPYPFSTGYPGEYIFDTHIKSDDIITASGKKGMIAFVDTNGFHRGGYVTTGERRVLMGTYLRPTTPYASSSKSLLIDDAASEMSGVPAIFAIS